MSTLIEVLFTPADFAALSRRDLRGATCVVFDVLRATSTMVTALANGADAIIPTCDIAEALEWKRRRPELLLGGERGGLRIGGALSGGIEFDFGNSPCEYTSNRVRGRTIVSTTTNGTRALQACLGTDRVWVGAFLNLSAVAARLNAAWPNRLWLVCSGTGEEAAWEDTLAAGALCDALSPKLADAEVSDSAHFARELYRQSAPDLAGSMRFSRNARRLLAMPALHDDVAYCLQRDVIHAAPALQPDGSVRLPDLPQPAPPPAQGTS